MRPRLFGVGLLGLFLLLGCGGADSPGGPQGSATITLSPQADTLNALLDTLAMEATTTDAEGNEVQTSGIEWLSTDPEVVTVDADGRVVSEGVGTVQVRAAWRDDADTADILVRQVLARFVVAPDDTTVMEGDQVQFSVTSAEDSNGVSMQDAPSPTWSVRNGDIATVDGSGLATAQGLGNTRVRAEAEGGPKGAGIMRVVWEGGTDGDPPDLANLSIEPDTGRVSEETRITLRFRATDVGSGVEDVAFSLEQVGTDWGGGTITISSQGGFFPSEGTALDGIWENSRFADDLNGPGTYFVSFVQVRDRESNDTVLQREELEDRGFETEFEVVD